MDQRPEPLGVVEVEVGAVGEEEEDSGQGLVVEILKKVGGHQ